MIPSATQLPYKTPAQVAKNLQLAGLSNISLLDSSHSTHHPAGKFSILCANPIHSTELQSRDTVQIGEAIESLNNLLPQTHSTLPFSGGTISAVSYPDKNGNISLISHLYSWAFVFDHSCNITTLVHWPEYSTEPQAKLISIFNADDTHTHKSANPLEFTATWNKESYTRAFNKIKDYILCGDTYQINLTQQFKAAITDAFNPLENFNNLSQLAQAPFSVYFESDNTTLLSASPERFIEIKNSLMQTQPIKGTRKRLHSQDADQEAKNSLQNSIKDRAENLMIVDLLRNDLGISSETGSVKVEALFAIETFGTVHHLVSTICSRLKPGFSPISAFMHAFPGGSITGAPKKRAMEIINEVETTNRGFYCGSLVYCSGGKLDSNILIRTFEVRKNENSIEVWGGGGIVADSNLDDEYQESLDKISRLIESIRD